MIVNADNYPNIIAAFSCMDEAAMSMSVPIAEIPARWIEHLPVVEKVLGSLSKTERDSGSEPLPAHVRPNEYLDSQWYTFINGEYHDMRAIENRSPEFGLASTFLNDRWEDWSLTGEDPKTSPQNVANQRRLEWLEEVRKESGLGLQGDQLEEYERLRLTLV